MGRSIFSRIAEILSKNLTFEVAKAVGKAVGKQIRIEQRFYEDVELSFRTTAFGTTDVPPDSP